MKNIFYVAFISIALPVFLFAAGTDASHGPAIDRAEHSQNDNKRRGRGRDDSNRHNGNRNSNNSNSNSSNSNRRSGSPISPAKARAIALQAVPGTVMKDEFKEKNGRSIYEFYIRKDSGETFELYVDAETGDIIKREWKSGR